MVERLLNNFVLAMALSALESWEQVQAQEKSRAIYNHPILHEAALDAAEVLKLLGDRVYAQEMFGFPHGKVWQPIDESQEVVS